ncbi:SDR family NAD(P)-dependent oxidoreductase [Burkholderia sp. D-99]|nr:SDR family NAD(P)-dependent oxidoreductase [Burkholderia sp. D-99]
MTLNDKVAVVTGAAQGIGHAIAKQLAQCGAEVVVNDVDEQRIACPAASTRAWCGSIPTRSCAGRRRTAASRPAAGGAKTESVRSIRIWKPGRR